MVEVSYAISAKELVPINGDPYNAKQTRRLGSPLEQNAMSSLIPERQLVISPSLAATIGLEEAILLQLLNDSSLFQPCRTKQGYQWYDLSQLNSSTLLPFWDTTTQQRVLHSLRDKGIILLEGQHFAMNEPQIQTSPPPYQTPTQFSSQRQLRHGGPGANLLDRTWQPDEDLLQLLQLNHAIPREFALQQREDFVLYWCDRGQVSHSWTSKFRQHVLKEWRHHQSRQTSTAPINSLTGEWQPSHDALEILQRTGISQDFIEDAVPEFVLYWRERGEASGTWNSKFIAHIRRQWAKYNQTLVLDYEPRPIPANWQPNEDVYDILRLANIDIAFARQLVAEFVLFWRDTKEIQRSWNTKFLQHAKYQWASRHHMEQRYAGQPVAHQSANPTSKDPFKQLTDRSWAEGIVKNL